VESFKSTLDEVRESDILLHVVDVAHPVHGDQIRTVQNLLEELGANEKPTLLVFNKIDLFRENNYDLYLDEEGRSEVEEDLRKGLESEFGHEAMLISAETRENLDALRERLTGMVKEEYQTTYPYVAKQW
jgi:GTP-binding protein HflX